MRIISEYHDYYDVVQAMGQDQAVVYLRRPVENFYKAYSDYPFPRLQAHGIWQYLRRLYAPTVDQYIVGFCGKIYPVLELNGNGWNWRGNVGGGSFCFNVDDVDRHIEATCKPEAVEEYRWKKPQRLNRYPRFRHYSPEARRELFVSFFAECSAKQNNFGQIFVDSKCPIFVATCTPISKWEAERHQDFGKITLNGSSLHPQRGLKELEFYRLFEPFTAFQELAMYFGNIAQPNRPIPTVSDKDLAEAKGFNKHSFRKDPQK